MTILEIKSASKTISIQKVFIRPDSEFDKLIATLKERVDAARVRTQ